MSPDGKQLAITVRNVKLADIYLLRVGETAPSKLPLSNFRANARPQSMWVATQDALIVSGAVGEEQGIWRVPLNGASPQRLRLNVGALVEARLSPDGQAVAYTTQPTRGRELWVLRGAIPGD